MAGKAKLEDVQLAEPIRDRILTSRIYRLVVSLRRSRNIACRRLFALAGFDWILVTRAGEAEPVMLIELAAWLGIDKSQASRAVSRIIKMGLVHRRTSRGDIELTPSGRRLYERGLPIGRARHRALTAGASKIELKNYVTALPTLLENAKSMLANEQALRLNKSKVEALQNDRYLFPWINSFLPIPTLTGLYGVVRRSGDFCYERVLGLSEFDWRVLSRSGAGQDIMLMQLVSELDRDKSQVGRSVKRLAALGLLKSTKIGSTRNVSISLTVKGKEAYHELERTAFERNRALIAGLSARQVGLLESFLAKLAINADKMLADETANEDRSRHAPSRQPANKCAGPRGGSRKRSNDNLRRASAR